MKNNQRRGKKLIEKPAGPDGLNDFASNKVVSLAVANTFRESQFLLTNFLDVFDLRVVLTGAAVRRKVFNWEAW